MRPLLLATLILGSFCSHAWAWGDTGHQVICEVAFRLAKPATQVEIQRLINSDPTAKFPDFSESCVFPDHPRIRASEHFLNLPRDSAGLTSDQCPLAQKCVLSAYAQTHVHEFAGCGARGKLPGMATRIRKIGVME
jgi:S1/P1 Nuclease